MEKPKVLVTGVPHLSVMQTLSDKFDFTYSKGEPYTRDDILRLLPEQDAVVLLGFKADREFIDAGAKLKIIATATVGFDNVDIDYAQKKGIVVSNTPENVRVSTAETALALMLNVMRHIDSLNQRMHAGEWTAMGDPRNQGTSIQGKTLGIFGMGRIGKTFAQFGQMLGMHVIYNSRHQLDAQTEDALQVKYVSFDELVQQADVLSLHAPATAATQNIINAEVFEAMKPTAFLINVARGALVDESALVTALKEKQISGAGLDVFANEPQVPTALTEFENVVMTPHAGTGTVETQDAIFAEAMANVEALLYDGKPTKMVNHVTKYE